MTTTIIIETGVDIPNANTLFIENADHMGLSNSLSTKRSCRTKQPNRCAYLMYRPDKSLTEVSEKRLEAIKGFTELGSDLKLCYARSIDPWSREYSGASQSGFIDSVGLKCILNC